MANAKIWFLPEGGSGYDSGDVETIDIARPLSRLEETPVVNIVGSESMYGRVFENHIGSRMELRITIEQIYALSGGQSDLIRKLFTLQNHLQRGGWFSIAADADKAWARWCTTNPGRGHRTVWYLDNPTPHITGVVANSDEVWFEGSPRGATLRELHTLHHYDGAFVTVDDAFVFDWQVSGAGIAQMLVHHRNFWPQLRLPLSDRSKPLLTDDHRFTYNFRGTFEVVPAFHVEGGFGF